METWVDIKGFEGYYHRSFLKPGVGVHVSRSTVVGHTVDSRVWFDLGLWPENRCFTVRVYSGRAVSQGIEVWSREEKGLAGDVLEAVIDYHPEWVKSK